MLMPKLETSSKDSNNIVHPDFIRMVYADIQRISSYLDSDRDEKSGKELHLEMIAKYPHYISRFGDSLYNYDPEIGFTMQKYFDYEAMIHNLMIMRSCLIAFRNFGCKNSTDATKKSGIHIENNMTSIQNVTVDISYENVRKEIEEMSGLSNAETEEVLQKIEEMKTIIESQDTKKSKWRKAKSVLLWLADKSVDVGICFLPLFLKIGA